MGLKELAATVVAAHPDLSAAKAAAVLRTALNALKQELSVAADGSVKCPPLGNFVISTKPGKADGTGDAAPRRKVVLRVGKLAEEGGDASNPARDAKRAAKKAERQAGKDERVAARKAAKKA